MIAHGTPTKYSYGCRCDLCRAARSEYDRRRRRGDTPRVPHGMTYTQNQYGRRGWNARCQCGWQVDSWTREGAGRAAVGHMRRVAITREVAQRREARTTS